MATYTIGDGSALGFPFAPGAFTVVRKTVDFSNLPTGVTNNVADVLNVIPVPPGAVFEAATVYVKRIDGTAGAAAISLNDSGGALIAAFSVAAVANFNFLTRKNYPTGDYLNIVCVKAVTLAKIEVVALFSNCGASNA